MILTVTTLLIFLEIEILWPNLPSSLNEEPQTVELVITGVRSEAGDLQLGVFQNQESFEREEPFEWASISKSDLDGGQLVTRLSLLPGKYAISVFDDVNRNESMDYNWIGVPKEGFGFSNLTHRGFRKPVFEDFQFEVRPGEPQTVQIKMRYLL